MPPTPDDDYIHSAEFYDRVVPYRERQDVTFFVDEARKSGGPVLEIGSGTGRILIPTARAGIEIVGLDLSQHMIEECRRNLERETQEVRSRVTIVRDNMVTFDLARKFRLITMPFRPFQHLLTVSDQTACLRRVHDHIEEGGIFILDLFNPLLERLVRDDIGQEVDEEPEFTMPDGRRVTRRARVLSRDLFKQVIQMDLIYDITHPDGRTERLLHPLTLRYFFRFEAEHLLARCGFALESVFSDYDRRPYGSHYPGELIMVSRKAPADQEIA
jgi:SAM-dependent methyltransferase